jgi:hypothetical protein
MTSRMLKKSWELCIGVEGDYFEGDGGPKLVLDQMAAPVPEIMDDSS